VLESFGENNEFDIPPERMLEKKNFSEIKEQNVEF